MPPRAPTDAELTWWMRRALDPSMPPPGWDPPELEADNDNQSEAA